MDEKSIILTKIAQADGTFKLRPALVLRKLLTYDDVLVCGISTQLHQEIENFDAILIPSIQNGLKEKSLIRLNFLAVLPHSESIRKIGEIDDALHQLLLRRLADYIKKEK